MAEWRVEKDWKRTGRAKIFIRLWQQKAALR